MAKLQFCSFVAGFSKRFAPPVVQSVSRQAGAGDANTASARSEESGPDEEAPDEEAPEGSSG